MSQLPDLIEDLGRPSDRLRPNPDFDPIRHPFDRDSYYVWSRIDGVTTLHDIVLVVGFPVDHTLAILRDLRGHGAILLPGESPASVAERLAAARPPSAPARPRAEISSHTPPAGLAAIPDLPPAGPAAAPATPVASPSAPLPALPPLTGEEHAALAATCALSSDSRTRIVAMRQRIRTGDFFAILEIGREADARTVKQAYRRLSKEFHPDRYYGRDTGPFGPFLAEIFETLTSAFEILSDEKQRSQHIARLTGQTGAAPKQPQTQAEHAAELFEHARQSETRGDKARALELFAAAIRIDPQSRYLRRAALCALSAHRLVEAEEYASKAASLDAKDASLLRLLANVYRALGKLTQAEKVLLAALALESENDALVGELRTELAEVRAAIQESRR